MHRNLALALVALILVAAGPARADLQSSADKLIAGDYKSAIAELGRVGGKDRSAARLWLARAQLEIGEYAAAEATAAAVVQQKDAQLVPARLLVAKVRRHVGKLADAQRDLELLAKERPDDREVRWLLSLVRRDVGDLKGAEALWQRSIDDFDARRIDFDNPDEMYWLAETARYMAQHQLANDSYREATKLRPQFTEAGVAWAELFLEKYASELAEQTLEEVFKVNPNHADAHAMMAAVILEKTYDLAAVRHHLDAAFAVNPKELRGLLVRASIEIDQNQWPRALATIGEVLAINPQHVEALALRATVAWLRDDQPAYQADRQRALAINPAFAEFYRIVARSAVREHRYLAAVELQKEAVKLDPKAYSAMADIGLGYLRLGLETEGIDWLKKAWAGDKYNIRTFNTKNLFERTIPKEYVFQTTKSFRIRYHKDERPVLSRYLEPTLERAFAGMVRRYGFTPKTPVVLELYGDRQDYAIRTVGLPDLGALGVCFGQVITAMSPANGDINWGMVLWHELSHVFAIQLSDSRVPRWFTEGLSEYETLIARPEWRRENDADLYGALVNKTLPSIADLNAEFMQPDASAVVVAYFLSAVTIEYLVQTYGFPKIVEALKLFAKGQETPAVLAAMTGKKIAELDAEFRVYLEQRLAPYARTFKLPTRGLDDLTKLEVAVDAAPQDALAAARLALGHYYAGDAPKAEAAVAKALALDAKQPIARYIQAELALAAGDGERAKQVLTSLVADGVDSFDIRSRLAQLAQAEGKLDEVERQLCAAKRLDPERSYPYQALAQLYKRAGRTAEALAELEGFVFLEQMDLAPLKELLSEHAKASAWAKVRTFGEMALYISPADPEVLLALGRAYLELGQSDRSLFTYDSALLVRPELRRPALAHLGRARALAALGKTRDAKGALTAALKTEPENAEALELRARLK
ncbi:MAG: tetratricopeptide repeat protein [Kofleriaceae bacterium]